MNPKFEVGEVVLLRSKSHPEADCESTILDIKEPLTAHPCEAGSGVVFRGPNYSYKLQVSVVHNGGLTSFWDETSLRKKHTPGEMSFTSLMASLSSPKLITHQT